MSQCSGDPGSYPEDGSGLAPPPLEDTSLHTAIDLKKRTEAASSKMDQVTSYLSCLKTRAVPCINGRELQTTLRFSQSWLKADPGVSNIFMFSCGRGVNCLHQIKIFLVRKQIFAKRKWRRWRDGGGGGGVCPSTKLVPGSCGLRFCLTSA